MNRAGINQADVQPVGKSTTLNEMSFTHKHSGSDLCTVQ